MKKCKKEKKKRGRKKGERGKKEEKEKGQLSLRSIFYQFFIRGECGGQSPPRFFLPFLKLAFPKTFKKYPKNQKNPGADSHTKVIQIQYSI